MDRILNQWADVRGYKMAWYDGGVVRLGFDRIRGLAGQGALEAGFYAAFLSWMDKPEVQEKAAARTMVLIAVPRPAHILVFETEGRRRELVLPPTYLRYYPLFEDVLADATAFTEDRLRLRLINAPLKTIAGLTGFARYGKNNITYVEGFGSAFQLIGLATDLALPGGVPTADGAPKALDECGSCRACLRACPAGAIVEDRFLFRGERCLTGFSETAGPLPEEFARLRTPALIGCLACQECCPANRGTIHFEKIAPAFNEEETAYLLGERGDKAPSQALLDKVRSLGCSDITMTDAGPSEIFRRNLRAVLKKNRMIPLNAYCGLHFY